MRLACPVRRMTRLNASPYKFNAIRETFMTPSFFRGIAAALALSTLLAGPALAADEHVAPMKQLAAAKVSAWAKDPVVIEAIKAQNAKHASLSQADIDKMDKTWRAEVKSGGPMIQSVLDNKLSAFLKKVKADAAGLYAEIFVMDDKGLNVGQSDVTSDYWQGDEAKWKETYSVGPDAVHISKISTDESSQTLQSQLSMAIADPVSGKVIGAVTVGVNVEQLGQ